MTPVLLILLLALILGGAGFALHILWVFAIVALVVWIVIELFSRRGPRTPA